MPINLPAKTETAKEPELSFGKDDAAEIDRILAGRAPEAKVDSGDDDDTDDDQAKKEDEPATWLDDDTAWLAEQHGINRDEALEFGSRKALIRTIARETKLRAELSAAPAGVTAKEKPGTEEVEDPMPEGLDLLRFDEVSQAAFKAIVKANNAVVKELRGELGKFTEAENKRKGEEFRDTFDATIRAVDPELFGADEFTKTPRELLARREKVFSKVIPDYFEALRQGEKPNLKKLIEGYTRFFFPEELDKRKDEAIKKVVTKPQRLATPGRTRPVAAGVSKHPADNPDLKAMWDDMVAETAAK